MFSISANNVDPYILQHRLLFVPYHVEIKLSASGLNDVQVYATHTGICVISSLLLLAVGRVYLCEKIESEKDRQTDRQRRRRELSVRPISNKQSCIQLTLYILTKIHLLQYR